MFQCDKPEYHAEATGNIKDKVRSMKNPYPLRGLSNNEKNLISLQLRIFDLSVPRNQYYSKWRKVRPIHPLYSDFLLSTVLAQS
jgi:hypothetical protein